ncbi:MAG: hypothetical protein HY303_20740, partial [Candidatus Wallbacteria bacterium]|nr:hypothetical protein [Candidatus Wallbacteria bacterium]
MTDSKLRRKIGKLFMFGFQGQEPSEPLAEFLREWGLGGVIVFTRNASC